MKNTIEFLNDIKTRYHLPSDYALAGKLELSRASISRFMNGKDNIGDETCLKVADLLDLDPAYVVACIHAERAKDASLKRLWERVATMTAGVSAALLVAWLAPHSGGEFGLMAASMSLSNVYYVKSLFEYWPVFLPLFVLLLASWPRHNSAKK